MAVAGKTSFLNLTISSSRGDPSVDWQYLCLDSERMLHDFRWYDGSGLKNRSRIICLLRAIESQFRDLLEEEDAGA
jgi:hypothetical protein